mmetsp:Transcript_97377/g.209981  ORF Transcript_97377/g.209981 Transcript_97377/m.209981 type:complete len:201 (-) Transcript_97377:192-794(-)
MKQGTRFEASSAEGPSTFDMTRSFSSSSPSPSASSCLVTAVATSAKPRRPSPSASSHLRPSVSITKPLASLQKPPSWASFFCLLFLFLSRSVMSRTPIGTWSSSGQNVRSPGRSGPPSTASAAAGAAAAARWSSKKTSAAPETAALPRITVWPGPQDLARTSSICWPGMSQAGGSSLSASAQPSSFTQGLLASCSWLLGR